MFYELQCPIVIGFFFVNLDFYISFYMLCVYNDLSCICNRDTIVIVVYTPHVDTFTIHYVNICSCLMTMWYDEVWIAIKVIYFSLSNVFQCILLNWSSIISWKKETTSAWMAIFSLFERFLGHSRVLPFQWFSIISMMKVIHVSIRISTNTGIILRVFTLMGT